MTMKKDQIELEEDVTMEQVHMYRQKYPILTEGEIILSIMLGMDKGKSPDESVEQTYQRVMKEKN